ncbi:MAG: ABC transporter ATP-binding protein [Anaerolineae bacterium]
MSRKQPSFKSSLTGLGRVMRHFWPQLRPQRGLLTLAVIAMLAEIGVSLLAPWPLKIVFDRVLIPATSQPAAVTVAPPVAESVALPQIAPLVWRWVESWPPLYAAQQAAEIASGTAPAAEKGIALLGLLLQTLGQWLLAGPFTFLLELNWAARSMQAAVTLPWAQTGASLDQLAAPLTSNPTALLTLAVIAVVVIAALRAGAAYANKVSLALAGNRLLTEVRRDVYHHLQALPLSYHTKAKSGDLITRLISDIGRLQEVAVTAVLPLLVNLLTLVGMVMLMLWLNWRLALVALAAFPLFLLTTLRLTTRIRQAAGEQRQREGAMAATATEAIGAIKVVQALAIEEKLENAFSRQNRKSLKEGVKGTRLSARLERSVDIIIALGTALVIWYGARLALRGLLTPGDLLVFMAYMKSAFKPMQDMAKYTGRMAKAAASGERVLDVLATTPAVRDAPQAVTAPAFRGEVRFENVSFAYDDGRPVLKNLNLTVQPGQRIALVGPSGAGKSTLVSLLLRLYDPTGGRVLVDGRDIRDYQLASLRRQVGVVLQDNVLFGVTARENIAYGRLDATNAEIEAAARLANAHDFIAAMPQGYQTVLGERGATLSGGQRQRIAIARAAVRHAPIIILDEPTTGLDRKNEQEVIEALERLTQGRTTFTIAHNLHAIEQADQILYVDDGQVVEQGSHAELMRLDGYYATMYSLQALLDSQPVRSRTGAEVRHAVAR